MYIMQRNVDMGCITTDFGDICYTPTSDDSDFAIVHVVLQHRYLQLDSKFGINGQSSMFGSAIAFKNPVNPLFCTHTLSIAPDRDNRTLCCRGR